MDGVVWLNGTKAKCIFVLSQVKHNPIETIFNYWPQACPSSFSEEIFYFLCSIHLQYTDNETDLCCMWYECHHEVGDVPLKYFHFIVL